MPIYDISIPISENMVVYPGDPEVCVGSLYSIGRGDAANVSELRMGTHTGTHLDAPRHFVREGLPVDQLPLDVLIGECFVCAVEDSREITRRELEAAAIPEGVSRVLFKTRNSELWREDGFRADYAYLTVDAAEWLLDRGIRLVGVDYYSVDSLNSTTYPVHRKLLESGVVIIEALDFTGVSEGMYTLICLPLKIADGDGSPARAVLIGGSHGVAQDIPSTDGD